jgi:uncharacterized protein YndB with AHSA1/START domain
MPEPASALAIRKSLTVRVPVETAFRVFTEEIGSWWPLTSKSVALEDALDLVIEARVGGRVYERTRAGEEHLWGEILVWEPPLGLTFSWHPGRAAESGQEVEVRFTRAGDGTLVELEHRGWEQLVGPGGRIPAHFESGWDDALARYVEAATGAGACAGT